MDNGPPGGVPPETHKRRKQRRVRGNPCRWAPHQPLDTQNATTGTNRHQKPENGPSGRRRQRNEPLADLTRHQRKAEKGDQILIQGPGTKLPNGRLKKSWGLTWPLFGGHVMAPRGPCRIAWGSFGRAHINFHLRGPGRGTLPDRSGFLWTRLYEFPHVRAQASLGVLMTALI